MDTCKNCRHWNGDKQDSVGMAKCDFLSNADSWLDASIPEEIQSSIVMVRSHVTFCCRWWEEIKEC